MAARKAVIVGTVGAFGVISAVPLAIAGLGFGTAGIGAGTFAVLFQSIVYGGLTAIVTSKKDDSEDSDDSSEEEKQEKKD